MSSVVRLSARDPSIDTLRALACIALVSYHVVGYTSASGMELPADHWLVVLNATFGDMRMPLFSFLSGYVFVSLEALTRPLGQLLLSKMRRLLLPLFSVGVLFWLANTGMGRAQPPLTSLLYLPYAHFWFLQATFVILASFLLLRAIWPGHSTTLACALMVFTALIWVTGPRASVNIFSINLTAYLMPFFMLGYLCAHGQVLRVLRAHVSRTLAAVMILLLLGVGTGLAAGWIGPPGPAARHALTLLIGAVYCLSLLVLAPRHEGLARIGSYSYTIYLFHVFFTAGSFESLRLLVPNLPEALVWLLGLAAGLAGPILLHHAVMRSAVLPTLLLGLNTRRGITRPVAPSGRAPNALVRPS